MITQSCALGWLKGFIFLCNEVVFLLWRIDVNFWYQHGTQSNSHSTHLRIWSATPFFATVTSIISIDELHSVSSNRRSWSHWNWHWTPKWAGTSTRDCRFGTGCQCWCTLGRSAFEPAVSVLVHQNRLWQTMNCWEFLDVFCWVFATTSTASTNVDGATRYMAIMSCIFGLISGAVGRALGLLWSVVLNADPLGLGSKPIRFQPFERFWAEQILRIGSNWIDQDSRHTCTHTILSM